MARPGATRRRLDEIHILQMADGCDVAERCIQCPLRACRFDDPAWFIKALRQVRDSAALAAYRHREKGVTVAEVARQYGVTEGTIYRAAREYQLGLDLSPEEVAGLRRVLEADHG